MAKTDGIDLQGPIEGRFGEGDAVRVDAREGELTFGRSVAEPAAV